MSKRPIEELSSEDEQQPSKKQNDLADDSESEAGDEEVNLILDRNDAELIEVDFEFFDPKEDDFWSIRQFLLNGGLESILFKKNQMEIFTELANAISLQGCVGTIIKSEADPQESVEENSAIGFLTVLNLSYQKKLKIIPNLQEIVLSKCPKEIKGKFEDFFKNKNSGWMLNKRMINTPLELISSLHQAVADDIQWAVKNVEGSIELRNSFKFEKILLLSKLTIEEMPEQRTIYKNFEDEYYTKIASASFKFEIPSQAQEKQSSVNSKDYCQVLLFDAKHLLNGSASKEILQLMTEIVLQQ
jgi:protein BCP1